MYTQFFQLKQPPFSIAPDPRYLFMSERHREALAHLLYGVDCGGGFVLLTGEIGAGKTTICRCLLEQIPENCHVAYIFNPKLSVIELLQSVCEEFRIGGIARSAAGITVKDYVDALNAYLLASHAEGKNNVLIIDEAQNLDAEILEQLRLLTNLETNERKLLQIILIGQPELRTMLARPELEQLAQRVIARYHLDALSLQETADYIQYRLATAGLNLPSPFAPKLMGTMRRITRGIPRRINLLCDRALLGAYAANRHDVTRDILVKAGKEVFGEAARAVSLRPHRWQFATAGILASVAILAAVSWHLARLGNNGGASGAPAVSVIDAPIKLALSLGETDPYGLNDDGPHGFAAIAAHGTKGLSGLPEAADAQQFSSRSESMAHLPHLPGVFNAAMRDERHAYRLLGQLWGIALKADNPCRQAEQRGILCYRSNGGLAELQRLDRPAVLTLHDSHNASIYALLLGLSPTTATLRMAGSSRDIEISLKELGKYFEGAFSTFWRAPPNYRKELGQGDRGEYVDWLAAQLSRLNGNIETVSGQAFSPAMARQIREFQTAQGLRPDGVAGPQTLMLLNRAAAINEPHLQPLMTAAATVPGK